MPRWEPRAWDSGMLLFHSLSGCPFSLTSAQACFTVPFKTFGYEGVWGRRESGGERQSQCLGAWGRVSPVSPPNACCCPGNREVGAGDQLPRKGVRGQSLCEELLPPLTPYGTLGHPVVST